MLEIPEWKRKMVAVMTGRRGGVSKLFKDELPHVVDIHCMAHWLELGAADVIKADGDMRRVTDMCNGKSYMVFKIVI